MTETRSPVPVVIPTMPERTEALNSVLWQLRSVPWARALISRHTVASEDYVRAWEAARIKDPRSEWLIAVEDDVWIGPGFSRIPKVLDTTGQEYDCLNFFALTWPDEAKGKATVLKRGPASLSMTQCVALRGGLVRGFRAFARQWFLDNPHEYHASDTVLGAYLSSIRARYGVFFPSLVQHRRMRSTLGPRSSARQSPSFRAVFGAVPGEPD